MSKGDFGVLVAALEKGQASWILMAQALGDLPDFAEMQRQYAEALGKEISALTETEKEQAFINAVFG